MERLFRLIFTLFLASLIFTSKAVLPQKANDGIKVSQGIEKSILEAKSLYDKHEYDSSLAIYKELSLSLIPSKDTLRRLEVLIKLADINKILKNYNFSKSYLDSAFTLTNEDINKANASSYIEILYQYSSIFISLRNFDSATYYLNKALQAKRESNHIVADTLLAAIYNNLGTISWYKRQYDKALDYYKMALDYALKKVNPTNEISASCYQNMGLVYIFLGDNDEAEKFLKESLEIKKITSGENSVTIARSYLNLGNFYNSISKVDLSYQLFKKAEEIYLDLFGDDYLELGHVYWDLANYYITIGDYDNAILYLNKALSIFEKNELESESDILSVKMNLGYIYEKQGKINRAIQYYESSMETDDIPIIIKAERNLGNLYAKIDSIELAIEYYKESVANSKYLYGSYSHDLGLSYLYYGEFLAKNDTPEKGLLYMNKALEIFQQIFGKSNRDVSRVQIKIGDVFYEKGSYDIAIDHYQKSIKDLLNKEELDFTPDSLQKYSIVDRVFIEAISKLANTYLRKYSENQNVIYLKYSFHYLILCSDIIVKLNDVYTDEESKLLLSNEAKVIYNRLVYVALSLFQENQDSSFLSDAFYYSERSKSSVLLASIRNIEAKTLGNIPSELRDYEKDLRLNINSYSRLMYEENNKPNPNSQKINLWRSKIFDLKQSLDSLVGYFEVEYPSYFYFKYNYDFIDPKGIQERLDSDETVVNYVLLDTLLISFVISKDEVTHSILPFDEIKLKEDIDYVSNFFNNRGFIDIDSSSFYSFVEHSNSLYRKLIGSLDEPSLTKRLIIIPDAELNHLSFDLLLKASPQNMAMDFRKLDYLLKHHIVSYTSSATLLFSIDKIPEVKKPKVLAFSPKYEWNVRSDSADTRNIEYMNLTPLPFAKQEVDQILSITNGRKFVNEEATERNFIKNAKDYSILHLAMHTIINDENPMYSKLAFYNDKSDVDDGFLNTYEIYNMELDGRLAVLSACNTGSGKLEKGEGVMNLARAFFYAGIPSVIMTLWTVDDKSGSEIINSFYIHLKQGDPIDEALNNAKLDFINSSSALKAHPYYWAGFVAIGKTDKLDLEQSGSSNSLLILIVIGIIVALTSILIFKKLK